MEYRNLELDIKIWSLTLYNQTLRVNISQLWFAQFAAKFQ